MEGFVPKYVVLSIDGGGIRGLVPAIVLEALENEIGQPINTFVDLLSGTSTGGILAIGLSTGVKAK